MNTEIVYAGVSVTKQQLRLLEHAVKNGGTTEVITLEHPAVKDLIQKGLIRTCRLRAGPLGIYVDEPGVTLTQFGKNFIKEVK